MLIDKINMYLDRMIFYGYNHPVELIILGLCIIIGLIVSHSYELHFETEMLKRIADADYRAKLIGKR